MVVYSKLMQSESGEEHIPVSFLGSLYGRPIFQFCIVAPFPDCKDHDARLYIETADGIDG